jgi:hypothetical protein
MAKKHIRTIPEPVRRWYRKIGAMGGQAGKGTELRRELMRRNANKRWAGERKRKAIQEERFREILVRIPANTPHLPRVGFK